MTSLSHNLFEHILAAFPADRSACAIETPDGRFYSWSDLDQASAKIAHLLVDSGLPSGTRVAAQIEKSPEALMLYLGTLRAGFVFLPLNTAYREAEIDYFLSDAEPGIVVCDRQDFGWISKLAFKFGAAHVYTLNEDVTGSLIERASAKSSQFKSVARDAGDLAAILYTSGTTGRSKGAMLTHANLLSNATVLKDFWGWEKGDVLLHALPLFHVHGLFVASHGALLNGSKMILLPRFDSQLVIKYLPRATVFMGVPTFYVRLLAEPEFGAGPCKSIRLFVCGSAPLLAETFEQFVARTGHTILERYGMSETTMLVSNPYTGARIAGTVGVPLPGVEVRIVNEHGDRLNAGEIGQIQVRGPNVFPGYWRMPEKTSEEFTDDGFFKTGDVGQMGLGEGRAQVDDDGYLRIVGRSKDLIITGGYNVYPKEIELLLDDLDGVLESAVVGVPHRDFGEAVTAVVVLKADGVADEATLIGKLKRDIANFKVPKRIHFVDELPRNAMGKVQKNLLRAKFSGQ